MTIEKRYFRTDVVPYLDKPETLLAPTCSSTEPKWVTFLTKGDLSLALEQVRIINQTGQQNWHIHALKKPSPEYGQPTFLCLTGPVAGMFAADLTYKTHRDWLKEAWQIPLEEIEKKQSINGSINGIILRPVLKKLFSPIQLDVWGEINLASYYLQKATHLPHHRKKFAERIRQNIPDCYLETILWLLAQRNIQVGEESFRTNVAIYHQWLKKQFEYDDQNLGISGK